jgi:hypothetical protein
MQALELSTPMPENSHVSDIGSVTKQRRRYIKHRS